jgi:F-type H+-transporting ATPase subunit epsilon
MAGGVFAVEVVMPERRLVEGLARAVVLRSSEGDLTVLDGHTPLVTDIVPGEVRVERPEGDALRLAVHGGYLQVGPDPGSSDPVGAGGDGGSASGPGEATTTRVTVLASVAELAGEIDIERAERAQAAASARVEQLKVAAAGSAQAATGEQADQAPSEAQRQLARAEEDLRRAEVRLAVAGATAS